MRVFALILIIVFGLLILSSCASTDYQCAACGGCKDTCTCEACPVTGKSGTCPEVSKAEICPVTGKTGECPEAAKAEVCPVSGKSGTCPEAG